MRANQLTLPGGGRRLLVWTPDSGSVHGNQNAGCPECTSHKGQRPTPVNQITHQTDQIDRYRQTDRQVQTGTDLSQVFEAASHQRMRTAFIGHLHRVLDQTQQLHRHLVDINDPAEDTVHILTRTQADRRSITLIRQTDNQSDR